MAEYVCALAHGSLNSMCNQKPKHTHAHTMEMGILVENEGNSFQIHSLTIYPLNVEFVSENSNAHTHTNTHRRTIHELCAVHSQYVV